MRGLCYYIRMAYYYSPFRKNYSKETNADGCPFCNEEEMSKQVICRSDGTLIENKYYRWIINTYPKFEGHTMLVPRKHILHIGEESAEEICAREELLLIASDALRKLYPGAGIEVFLQTAGESASSVEHLHWHVVPALKDDNLRSFEKLGHFYTIEPEEEKIVIFPHRIEKGGDVLQEALRNVL